MRKSKFTESQIVGILKEAEAGVPVLFSTTHYQVILHPRVRLRIRSLSAPECADCVATTPGRHGG